MSEIPKFRYVNHFLIVWIWDSYYYFSMIISSRSYDERHNNYLNIGIYCHMGHDGVSEAPA